MSDSAPADETAPGGLVRAPQLAGLFEARSGPRGVLAGLTRWQVVALAQAVEIATIVAVSLLVGMAGVHGGAGALPRYATGSVLIALACYASFFQAGLYEIAMLRESARAMGPLCMSWSIVFAVLAALAGLAHEPQLYSRFWFGGFYALGIIALGFERRGVETLIGVWVRAGNFTKSVAIVGGDELADRLIGKLRHHQSGIQVVGVFDDRMAGSLDRVPTRHGRGSIAALLEYAKTAPVDLVVITLPIAASERIQAVIKTLQMQPFDIRILPGEIGLQRLSPIRLARDELPGVQLIAVTNRPISALKLFLKETFDRIAAGIALLLLSPVLLVCAMGILIGDGGPVIFRQVRIGYKGREFTIFKFRTMRHVRAPAVTSGARNNPAVFWFGALLRRYSLDELPQLFNVLNGDMSMVGPRPHMIGQLVAGTSFFEALNEYACRHRVKPGMTGWAQVNGWRGPAETLEQIEKRVEYDIFYIENWSLLLDMVILVRTLFCLGGKNAF